MGIKLIHLLYLETWLPTGDTRAPYHSFWTVLKFDIPLCSLIITGKIKTVNPSLFLVIFIGICFGPKGSSGSSG